MKTKPRQRLPFFGQFEYYAQENRISKYIGQILINGAGDEEMFSFENNNNNTEHQHEECKKAIALTQLQIVTKQKRIHELTEEVHARHKNQLALEDKIATLINNQKKHDKDIALNNQRLENAKTQLNEESAALCDLAIRFKDLDDAHKSKNKPFSFSKTEQQQTEIDQLFDNKLLIEQRLESSKKKIEQLENQKNQRPNIFETYQTYLQKKHAQKTDLDSFIRSCTYQELIVINTKQSQIITTQLLPEANKQHRRAKARYEEKAASLATVKSEFTDLENTLLQLVVTENLLDLTAKLTTAKATVAAAKDRTTTLKNSEFSFELVVSLYNESRQFNEKNHFTDITKKLTTLRAKLTKETLENPLYKSALALLDEKENELNRYNAELTQTLEERRAAAEAGTLQIALSISNRIEGLAQKLAKIKPSITAIQTNHQQILKRIQRKWFSPEDLKHNLATLSKDVNSSLNDTAHLYSEVNTQRSVIETLPEKKAFTAKLNINGFFATIGTLHLDYQQSSNALKYSDRQLDKDINDLTERYTIETTYSSLLNNYETYRNHRYFLKDLFSNKDKKARQQYIAELKHALHEYSYLNYDHDKLDKLIQQGITQFPTGKMSNTKDPTKNLNGILTLLLKTLSSSKAASKASPPVHSAQQGQSHGLRL